MSSKNLPNLIKDCPIEVQEYIDSLEKSKAKNKLDMISIHKKLTAFNKIHKIVFGKKAGDEYYDSQYNQFYDDESSESFSEFSFKQIKYVFENLKESK